MKRRNMKTSHGETDSSGVTRASTGIAIAVSALFACGGCDSSTDPDGLRVGVNGQVRLDGKPLEAGAILFHSGEGENKVVAFGYIADGAYEIASKDGPRLGMARVEFQAKPVDQGQFEAAMEEAVRWRRRPNLAVVAIPRQYRANSTLTAEVTEDGENNFDFDLKSRP